MSGKRSFDQSRYWIERHQKFFDDVRSAEDATSFKERLSRGDAGLIELVRTFARKVNATSVLDLGCGFGRICEAFSGSPDVRYVGIDVSPAAIEQARAMFPDREFRCLDLTTWSPDEKYDLIVLAYTLSSFVDESDWENLIRRCVGSLSTNGAILIFDQIIEPTIGSGAHVLTRPEPVYNRLFADERLEWRDDLRSEIIGALRGRVVDDLRIVTRSNERLEITTRKPADRNGLVRKGRVLPNAKVVKTPAVEKTSKARRSMFIICWDMGHNPVGRGYVLADMARSDFDVTLFGPLFPQFGGKLWGPIESQKEIDVVTFRCESTGDFFAKVMPLIEAHTPDVVYISKPRLPSLIIGILFHQVKGSQVILDIDDHELSFFKERTPLPPSEAFDLAKRDPTASASLYSEVWTRLSEHLIKSFKSRTVSNAALQKLFGGSIVRHGRNEKVFSPDLAIRERVRSEFGVAPGDVAVVFIGTPRPHKGIFRIAAALDKLNDDKLVFIIIGSIKDARTRNEFKKYPRARISFFEDQPWERLHELISMSDVVAILQDSSSPISEYQIPAKLTDALALGVPTLVTAVPPFVDIIATGAVRKIESDAELQEVLAAARNYEELSGKEREQRRKVFLDEFSYSVNSSRIAAVVEAAGQRPQVTGSEPAEAVVALAASVGYRHPFIDLLKQAAIQAPAVRAGVSTVDLVFFWKQNDSELYGRRSDMMLKYMLKDRHVGRVLHFDRPLTLTELNRNADRSRNAKFSQGNFVYVNTVRRILKLDDTPQIARRTFLARDGSVPQSFAGADLPPKSGYVDFVKSTLNEAGFDRPLGWVCPIVFDFPGLSNVVPFRAVVADVIDDQRKWESKADYKAKVTENYRLILTAADLVVVNCEPVKTGFADLRDDIVVVPNGAEVFDEARAWAPPEDLATLPKPIIGYVGNLRDRIDIPLIEKLAGAFPEASVVLVGSAHDADHIIKMVARHPNIHLFGVRPYDQALAYIKNFQVAIMPHLSNDLSQNMNPLKLYVYYSLGVPVVTSEVANIADVGPHVAVASGHEDFIQKVGDVIFQPPRHRPNRSAELDAISWSHRVANIFSHLRSVT